MNEAHDAPAAHGVLCTAVATLVLVHGQQFPGSGVAHAGFSHCNSHFGRAQLVGFTHLLVQSNCSHTGAHFGCGAVQVVWQRAGWHTVSHFGQPLFSHDSFGQRIEHTGRSQCTTHLAHGVCSHFISHLGRAHTG